MPQQITPFSITAPGFMGLNKQDAPVDLSSNFALEANNCVIDQAGRIASRKGWKTVHDANTDLGSADITCIGELIENDGTSTILAAGNGFLFKLSGTTLVTLAYGGGGIAPTISANNWLFTQLNGIGIFFQRGYDPLIYDPAISTTTFRRMSEKAGYAGTIPQANAATSAYGRIWCADTATDKNTVKWSDVITPHIWTGGTSGSLNLLGVWPVGGDEIVAVAAHNNFLAIFGRKQILLYSGADEPSTMTLSDSVNGIGCIARDSVQNTGEDIIFLANDGVRSLMRTIQEKSSPMRNVSRNVNDEIIAASLGETSAIKSVYSRSNQFYLLTFPTAMATYCFDMRSQLQDGSSRATIWKTINPSCFCETRDRKLYLGKAGYIGEYYGFLDDTNSFRMKYYTPWIDFGNPVQMSILKKIILTIIGSSNQTILFKWAYDFLPVYYSENKVPNPSGTLMEWGLFEWNGGAEWGGVVGVDVISANGSGHGRLIQFGFEVDVAGRSFSVQKIDLFTKDGRL